MATNENDSYEAVAVAHRKAVLEEAAKYTRFTPAPEDDETPRERAVREWRAVRPKDRTSVLEFLRHRAKVCDEAVRLHQAIGDARNARSYAEEATAMRAAATLLRQAQGGRK